MNFADLNLVAVFIAAVVTYLFAWFWYSYKAFGQEWSRGLGYRSEELNMQWYHFVGGFLVSFVTAWVFAGIINHYNILDVREGVELGFWIWLGFIVTTFFSGYLWEKKTFNVFLINIGFQLISLLFLGAFLTYWR